ncbi:VWD domain-containing protein [Streptomyces sp. SPB162]|uniref:VWD domain-containing protein n=1 Tax=Streptomyces sp. SPB162 TaxID=2940560 RepID=UPI0024060717|nr:VWD domain-containing protein [Streptomyces sp. SPB162]MDF9817202.1 hypothetical protein [Streptomyces sp. SPB162]
MSTRRNLGYAWNPATKTYTSTPCVLDPRALVPNAAYKKPDCKPLGLQGENIAQTRVIAQLNAAGVYGDRSTTGITPNLQWETINPVNEARPDLLLYDHASTTGPIGLVEMKGEWRTGDDPVKEVTDYVNNWPLAGHTVVAYHFTKPISDNFEIQLDPACKWDPAQHSAWVFHTYSDPANDGVIRISRTFRECPKRQKQSDEDERKQSYEGTIGADADHNGVDDFWDYIRKHPELWFLTGPVCAPAFHALPKPVFVSLNRDAIMAIEEAAEDAATDAIDAEWAALVDSMPEVVADASADILAGDAAALGLDAAELALAEAALDAGFITLSAAFLVPVIAAAVLVAIWAVMHWHLFGDPHMTTLDGLAYDLQDAGEFKVVHVPSLDLDIQARFLPQSGSRTFTVVDSVAFSINGAYVELHQNGDAFVNSEPIPASQKLTDFGQGAALVRSGNKFVATFGAAGARLAFSDSSLGFDIAPGVPTTGLLGNNDGIPGNDLVLSDGTPISSPSASVLDGPYANSWRLTDNQSDFTYPDDKTTASYTDLTFPSNVVTLGDFAQADQDLARQACNAQAVPAGPQFDACMLDVAQTGDTNYAKAAAAVTDVLQDSAAHTVDAGGTVTENFEAAVGPNFRPDSIESIGGTKAAGPVFDGSGYSFTVPSLPNHSGATVAFDVYAVGVTSTNAQNQTLTVKVGDPATSSVVAFAPTTANVSSGPATISALGQGQTPQGTAYQRYRITMPTPQYSDQLRVQLTLSGFRGIIGTSLAVDNISVGASLVPAQTFSAALPLSVSSGTVNGTAVAGAGTLENTGSADVYSFTVPTGGERLNLNLGSCPTAGQSDGVHWTLQTSAGRTAASGYCDAAGLGLLAAGQYTLNVRGPGVVGSYSLNLEAPQSFAATVPLSVTANNLNGTATTGAGMFEDGASQDVYAFSVPAGGLPLALSMRSCPASDNYSPGTWTLRDTATQSLVRSGYGGCSYADFGTLPAGSYQLNVAANGTAGPYTLDLLPPQSFAATLPLTTSANTMNGVSVPGASTFETGASQDVYTFTVPVDGQTLNLDVSACPTANYSTPLHWKLLSTATGTVLANGGCSYANLGPLAAGGYQLVVSAGGVAGGYALNLEAPQGFVATFPLAVSPDRLGGATATGAGRFETAASQDVYVVTAPSDGSPVLLNIASCPTVSYSTSLTWRLLDSSGAAIAHGRCGASSLGVLPAGNYRLAVDSGGLAGTYSLFATAGGGGTPAATLDGTPNVVTTTVAAQSVAIGFVNPTSQTVAVTGSSTLTSGDCAYSSLIFTLYDHTGAEVTHGGLQCGSAGMLYSPVLPSGSYTVLIVPPAPVTGKLGVQIFGASTSAVTATLDGKPASVTTAAASQSVMVSITNPTSQAVTITGSSAIATGDCNYYSVKFYLYDHAGTQVKSGSLSCDTSGVLYSPTLAAGSYTMLIAPPGPVTGTYSVQFFGAGASMATANLDGTPASVTTTAAAQSVAFGFTVPANQAVTITGSSVTTGDCHYSSVKFYLYDHSGARAEQRKPQLRHVRCAVRQSPGSRVLHGPRGSSGSGDRHLRRPGLRREHPDRGHVGRHPERSDHHARLAVGCCPVHRSKQPGGDDHRFVRDHRRLRLLIGEVLPLRQFRHPGEEPERRLQHGERLVRCDAGGGVLHGPRGSSGAGDRHLYGPGVRGYSAGDSRVERHTKGGDHHHSLPVGRNRVHRSDKPGRDDHGLLHDSHRRLRLLIGQVLPLRQHGHPAEQREPQLRERGRSVLSDARRRRVHHGDCAAERADRYLRRSGLRHRRGDGDGRAERHTSILHHHSRLAIRSDRLHGPVRRIRHDHRLVGDHRWRLRVLVRALLPVRPRRRAAEEHQPQLRQRGLAVHRDPYRRVLHGADRAARPGDREIQRSGLRGGYVIRHSHDERCAGGSEDDRRGAGGVDRLHELHRAERGADGFLDDHRRRLRIHVRVLLPVRPHRYPTQERKPQLCKQRIAVHDVGVASGVLHRADRADRPCVRHARIAGGESLTRRC